MATPKRPAFVFTTLKRRPRRCAGCGATLDSATGVSVDPNDPAPVMAVGDLTTCAYCRTTQVATATGFRLATDADLAQLDPDLRRLVQQFKRRGTH